MSLVATVFVTVGVASTFWPRVWIRFWRENAALPVTRQLMGNERDVSNIAYTSMLGAFFLAFSLFLLFTIAVVARSA